MSYSYPRRGRPDFRVAPVGWPKTTIFGNLSSFICRTWPSHLNLSFIIALKSGIKPHFCTVYCWIRSVSWVPRTIRWQFLWGTSSKFSSAFRSAHASEPNLITVITVPSNILILICRLIFLLFLSTKACWYLSAAFLGPSRRKALYC